MKTCTKCKVEQNLLDFSKNKNLKDGYHSICKNCIRKYQKDNRKKLNEYNQKWYEVNKETIKISQKKFRESEKSKAYKKAYNIKNREKQKLYNKEYRLKNRDKLNKYASENQKRNLSKIIIQRKIRIKNDIQYKLSINLRSRIRMALKHNKKVGSAVKDLGCTLGEFKLYLESKFQWGMTWENHGLGIDKWNIDHIIPLSSFKLEIREEFLRACHYTNLQPLWTLDNIRKSNK